MHYFLEKAFWHVEDHLDKINALYFDTTSDQDINLIVESDDNSLKNLLKKIKITDKIGTSKTVNFDILKNSEFDKLPKSKLSDLYTIYSPSDITNNTSILEGRSN